MVQFECNACGGSLKEDGRFLVCENCGTKYLTGRDDEGQPFTYQPVEKKEISCGQMGVRAAEIQVETVQVRDIRLDEHIAVEVQQESLNLDVNETIRLIETYVKAYEWDAAQNQINNLLLVDNRSPHARWYGMMCEKKKSRVDEFIRAWVNVSEFDCKKLDDILANSSPQFAHDVVTNLLRCEHGNDEAGEALLSVAFPYACNRSVLTESEYANSISAAFETAIRYHRNKTFLFLLKHALKPDEIDRYITYLERFADGWMELLASEAQGFYQMILDVDPGNLGVWKKLIKADLDSDMTAESKCIRDFEGMLRYSKDTNSTVTETLEYLSSTQKTTKRKSTVFRALLGYHDKAPAGLTDALKKYGFILLNSALWNEAKDCFYLILSTNARDSDAYWGLALARIQVRNESTIALSKENLTVCPEFHKCIALLQSENKTKRVSELMAYAKVQRNTKKCIKLIGIVAAILVLIIGISTVFSRIAEARRFSLKNLEIEIFSKEDGALYGKSDSVIFQTEIHNGSILDLECFNGIVTVYNSDGDVLMHQNFWMNEKIPSKETAPVYWIFDVSDSEFYDELMFLGLENIKITLQYESCTYRSEFDFYDKQYQDPKEIVLHKVTQKLSYEKYVKEQYKKGIDAYKAVDMESETAEDDILAAIALMDDVWYGVITSESMLKDMYELAMDYKNDGAYMKAFYLFALLETVPYKDSATQMAECYNFAVSA